MHKSQSEQYRLFETLLSKVTDAFAFIATDGTIYECNSAFSQLTGLNKEDVLGSNWMDVIQLHDMLEGPQVEELAPLNSLMDVVRWNEPKDLDLCLTGKQSLSVEVTIGQISSRAGSSQDWVMILKDKSTKEQLESQMQRLDSLESLSLLTGGVAHDFNNLLTVVLGNVSMARLELQESGPLAEQLLLAEKAAMQAKELTDQLLRLAKGGSSAADAVTIDEIVEEGAQFILRGTNVTYSVEKDEKLWPAHVNRGQMSQVVNNLVINARQAMPRGGVLRVSLENKTLKSEAVEGLKAGDYICIEFSDKGMGISAEDITHIFEPYYTTKQDGSGLGLASSLSIIKKYGGIISADSELGKGTTFIIYLPRSEQEKPIHTLDSVSNNTIQKGSGRILIMDDMEAMKLVAGEILEALGYATVLTSNGEEAIESYKRAKESGDPFDAVVFDLTVPGGMGGEEACKLLRAYDPNLVAIATSGYTNSDVMSDYQGAGFNAVIPKPYRIKEMSRALYLLLNESD